MDAFLAFLAEDWASLLLLVFGFALMVIEMYIPGFGIAGISGIVCLGAGIWIMADTVGEGLLILLVVIGLLCIAFSVTLRSAAKGRLANSKLVLHETATGNTENDLSYYLGHEGTALTALRPAGRGEFDGVKLGVEADGEYIEAGSAICVKAVEGSRIVVESKRA